MIKTITAKSPEELDTKVNEFEKQEYCFATQTHIVDTLAESTLYIAVVFYRPKTPNTEPKDKTA